MEVVILDSGAEKYTSLGSTAVYDGRARGQVGGDQGSYPYPFISAIPQNTPNFPHISYCFVKYPYSWRKKFNVMKIERDYTSFMLECYSQVRCNVYPHTKPVNYTRTHSHTQALFG
jgi:hypothetical protein